MCHKKVEIVTKTWPRSILSPIAFSPPFNIREIKSDYFDRGDSGGIVFNHRYDNDDGADTIKYDKNAFSACSSDNDDGNEESSLRIRPLRDPGIFSRSRSRDSHFFSGFPEALLNDCILRLSTPFIDHNSLFWDLWSLQECQKSLFKLLIFQQPIFDMD